MKLALRFKGMERSSSVVEHAPNGPEEGADKRCRVEVSGPLGTPSRASGART